jgi:hypothetical protein
MVDELPSGVRHRAGVAGGVMYRAACGARGRVSGSRAEMRRATSSPGRGEVMDARSVTDDAQASYSTQGVPGYD